VTLIRTGPFAGFPRNGFAVIYPDPPWRFLTYDRVKVTGRGKTKHYDTMQTEEIAALPVADLAADDCALFIWIHNSMIKQAITVIEAWGFTLINPAFVWTKVTKDGKPHMSNGYTGTRSCTEQCWLATKGHPKRLSMSVRQAILERRREPHQKPDRVRGDIERLFAGPYIELFARARCEGWSSWGRELDKFPMVTEADKYPDKFPAVKSALKWEADGFQPLFEWRAAA
jgi:N6-adenosine-specific RNA methylase IME4